MGGKFSKMFIGKINYKPQEIIFSLSTEECPPLLEFHIYHFNI